jgi:cell fate regulator YaaT (PSP1 superfamily)
MTPEIVEVSFKRNKRLPYFNPKELKIKPGDYVMVEAEKGIDIGVVSKTGRLVSFADITGTPRAIIRKAVDDDLSRLKENRRREVLATQIGRQKIMQHKLKMKLVDVEYQYDQNKLTFYFTSDKRVDFRNLVRDLASKYKTRIELRQIGVRDETKRIGGLGICGKPYCCSLFMKEFEPISTQYAKEQNLPLNPGKLAGVCGRLKCCLAFERSFYQESLKKYPPLDAMIKTDRGIVIVDKIDIFNEAVYLRYRDEETIESVSLKEVQKMGFSKKRRK